MARLAVYGDKIQPFLMTTLHHFYDLLQTETSSTVFLSMVRLVLAGILGGLIGLEREMKHRPAGVRTNMFICFGLPCSPFCRISSKPDIPAATIPALPHRLSR